MSHRIGTCASCGATYKLPASFAADKARCKECEGVVEIGAIEGEAPAATPKPTAAPVPAKRVPAKPVRAKCSAPAAKPKAEPKPKKRSGPSMKERLLEERRAAAEGAGEQQPALAKKPTAVRRPGVLKKAAAAKAEPAARGTKESGSKSAAPASRHRGSSSRRRRGAAAEGGEDVRERLRKTKKSPLVPALAALAALGLAGGTVWYMMDSEKAGSELSEEPAAVETQDETGTSSEPEEAPSPDSQAEPEDEPEPEPEPKPKPVKRKDPASIDLTAIGDYGSIPGLTDDEFSKLQRLAVTMIDPEAGAAGNRARMALLNAEKSAFPAVLNVMKDIDFSTEQGFRDGDLCQRLLMEICNGNNFGWKYSALEEDEWFNKFVVQRWCTQWDRAKDDEAYWLKFSKQDAAPEAATDAGEPAISDDDLDDLDDLDG